MNRRRTLNLESNKEAEERKKDHTPLEAFCNGFYLQKHRRNMFQDEGTCSQFLNKLECCLQDIVLDNFTQLADEFGKRHNEFSDLCKTNGKPNTNAGKWLKSMLFLSVGVKSFQLSTQISEEQALER